MLVKFTIQIPRTQAEYLYGLALSRRLFTMQVTDSWRVSIYNKYENVCMICEMHNPNYENAIELC